VEACGRGIPGARIEVMPGVGHGAPVQAGKAFVDRVLDFISRQRGA
jgi:pimeloyl-ACP methyl ester carboxylesterase